MSSPSLALAELLGELSQDLDTSFSRDELAELVETLSSRYGSSLLTLTSRNDMDNANKTNESEPSLKKTRTTNCDELFHRDCATCEVLAQLEKDIDNHSFYNPAYGEIAARFFIRRFEYWTTRSFSQFFLGVNEFSASDSVTKQGQDYFKPMIVEFVKQNAAALDSMICFDRNLKFKTLYSVRALSKSGLRNPDGRTMANEPFQFSFMRTALQAALEIDNPEGKASLPDDNTNIIFEQPMVHTNEQRLNYVERFYKRFSQQEIAPPTPMLVNACIQAQKGMFSTCFTQPTFTSSSQTYSAAAVSSATSSVSKTQNNRATQFVRDAPYGSHGIPGFGYDSISGLAQELKNPDIGTQSFRKPVVSVYLSPDSVKVSEFLKLKDPFGPEETTARDAHIGLWVSDHFMQCVKEDRDWKLFAPETCAELNKSFGQGYVDAYERAIPVETVKARWLYDRIVDMQRKSGEPYILFKDTIRKQSTEPAFVVHSSNLCAEVVQSCDEKTASVCCVTTVNASVFCMKRGMKSKSTTPNATRAPGSDTDYALCDTYDWAGLIEASRNAQCVMDAMVNDIFNSSLPDEIKNGAMFRSLGIGLQGCVTAMQKMGLRYDSEEGICFTHNLYEALYFGTLNGSCKAAEKYGRHKWFDVSSDSAGRGNKLQFELPVQLQQGEVGGSRERDGKLNGITRAMWDDLKQRIVKFGLRNSNLTAQQPSVYWSRVFGNAQGGDPLVSNMFMQRDFVGEFPDVNGTLVDILKSKNLWSRKLAEQILANGGSLRNINSLPASLNAQGQNQIPQAIKDIFQTAYEYPVQCQYHHAAARIRFLSQSDSFNVFLKKPDADQLGALHMLGWEHGLKTGMYYLKMQAANDATRMQELVGTPPTSKSKHVNNNKRVPNLETHLKNVRQRIKRIVGSTDPEDGQLILSEALRHKLTEAYKLGESVDAEINGTVSSTATPLTGIDSKMLKHAETLLALHWLAAEFNDTLRVFKAKAKQLREAHDPMYTVIEKILMFFAVSDKIVRENLQGNFLQDVISDSLVTEMVYELQDRNEDQHDKTYENLLLQLWDVSDSETFDTPPTTARAAVEASKTCWQHDPSHPIHKKVAFAQKYMDSKAIGRMERLLAFCCVEGMMFSCSFSYLFYMKNRFGGELGPLTFSNDFIARDESLHTDIAIDLLKDMLEKTTSEAFRAAFVKTAKEIIHAAADAEIAFVRHVFGSDEDHEANRAIAQKIPGLQEAQMIAYVQFVANGIFTRVFSSFAPDEGTKYLLYPTVTICPFEFMLQQGALARDDQMSRRSSLYMGDTQSLNFTRLMRMLDVFRTAKADEHADANDEQLWSSDSSHGVVTERSANKKCTFRTEDANADTCGCIG